MAEIIIRVGNHTRVTTAECGASLLAVLQQAGQALPALCGGGHTCGKCLVRVSGALSEVSAQERALLTGQTADTRLACFATVQGPCAVILDEVRAAQILTGGLTGATVKQPLFGAGYGVAVDIGTTTVAAYLFGGVDATPLAVLGEFNHQQRYGADVMTRIAFDNEDLRKTLCHMIRQQIAAMIGALCAKVGLPAAAVTAVVLTGNTTMLHLLAGYAVRSLALNPYTPVSLFGDWLEPLLPGYAQAKCYLPRCISAYVGADITCGILASDMLHRAGTVLLVDIGTNGEMALKTGERLVCCSAAAGPAFEGAGISCGSGATEGAICRVTAEGGRLTWEAIGGGMATSLCGSGLIDAVAASLRLGYLSSAGTIKKELDGCITLPDCGVMLTQKDLRQVQLAKGAIRGGIDTMLHHCGLTYGAIDQILLCGGFGSYLSPESAETIGMLPPGSAGKISVIGNAAGAGAAMLLLNRDAEEAALEITRRAVCIELSADPYFMDQFIAELNF